MRKNFFHTKILVFLLFFVFSFSPVLVRASAVDISRVKNISGLVGWWTLDGKDTPWTSSTAGTTLDKSGNSNTGTLTNMSRATSPIPGKIGQGLKFDNTDDVINIPASSTLQFGNGTSDTAWTAAAWVYRNSAGGVDTIIDAAEGTAGVVDYIDWYFVLNSNDTLQVLLFSNSAGTNIIAKNTDSSFAADVGSWHHYAFTYDGSSTAAGIKFYRDGSLVTSNNTGSAGTYVAQSATPHKVTIGYFEPGGTYAGSPMDGKIDDVRTYNRALSTAEVTQLYDQGAGGHSNVTTPTKNIQSGLVGWWTLDGKDTPWSSSTAGTTLDKSGNNNTGTLSGMTRATTPAPGKIGQGLKFDGVDDAVTMGNLASAKNISQISITAWVKPNVATPVAQETIVSKYREGFGAWQLSRLNSSNLYACYIWNNAGSVGLAFSSTTYADTKWHHLVCKWDGSSVIMYVDGVAGTPVALSGSTIKDRSDPVCIGGQTSNNIDCNIVFAPATIDDVRIYNRALSAIEISKLYDQSAGGHQNVSNPTKGIQSGLVGHWTFDGKDTPWSSSSAGTTLDKSGNNNTGTLTNMSRSTTPAPGKIGQTLNFDGTDDRVALSNVNILEGYNAGTLSLWFNRPVGSTGSAFVYSISNGAAIDYSALSLSPGAILSANDSLAFEVIRSSVFRLQMIVQNGATVYSDGKWHHVVVSTGNGNNSIYIDGQSQTIAYATGDATTAEFSNITSQSAARIGNIRVFNLEGSFFPGKIDDVRVYNRALSATEVQQLYDRGK